MEALILNLYETFRPMLLNTINTIYTLDIAMSLRKRFLTFQGAMATKRGNFLDFYGKLTGKILAVCALTSVFVSCFDSTPFCTNILALMDEFFHERKCCSTALRVSLAISIVTVPNKG